MVMQVSTTQAAKAFAALRANRHRSRTRRRRARPTKGANPQTIDAALSQIASLPETRATHVQRASQRIASGAEPTPTEVADAMIRRSTCASLR